MEDEFLPKSTFKKQKIDFKAFYSFNLKVSAF